MKLTEQEVQDLINDPRLCRPYDLARGVEAALLDKIKGEEPALCRQAVPAAEKTEP